MAANPAMKGRLPSTTTSPGHWSDRHVEMVEACAKLEAARKCASGHRPAALDHNRGGEHCAADRGRLECALLRARKLSGSRYQPEGRLAPGVPNDARRRRMRDTHDVYAETNQVFAPLSS